MLKKKKKAKRQNPLNNETPLSLILPRLQKAKEGKEKKSTRACVCVSVWVCAHMSGCVCTHISPWFVSKHGRDEASGSWVTGRRTLGKGLLNERPF